MTSHEQKTASQSEMLLENSDELLQVFFLFKALKFTTYNSFNISKKIPLKNGRTLVSQVSSNIHK